jgi:proline iminopeptidase
MLVFAALIGGTVGATERAPPRFAKSVDGARIAYYAPENLRGVPLLVLSGGPGTDSRYMQVGGALDELARSRSIVYFDQRGTAASSRSTGTETIARYVEDLEAIRLDMSVPRIDLLGHSFGGYLAIAYAARHPARVRSLVLVDSAPPKLSDLKSLLATVYPDRIEAWRSKRATLTDNNRSADSAIFMSMEFVTDAAFRDYLAAVADHRDNMTVNNALRRDMEGLDYWTAVRQFKLPVLVVHGRFDSVVAPENGWQIHQAIPNSEFRIIESAGHLPHIEQPKQFLEAVRPFFARVDESNPVPLE